MKDLTPQAVEVVRREVVRDGPEDPRVCPGPSQTRWDSDLLRTVSRHRLTVLARSPDICVFYDSAGGFLGFRDEAARGTHHPVPTSPEGFLGYVRGQLDLGEQARAGRCQSVRLDYAGWCCEGVIFLKDPSAPQDVLTVWINSLNGQIIQCLYRNGPGRPVA